MNIEETETTEETKTDKFFNVVQTVTRVAIVAITTYKVVGYVRTWNENHNAEDVVEVLDPA